MENYDSNQAAGNGRKIIFFMVAIAAIGGLAIGGYYLVKQGDNVPVASVSSTPTPEPTIDPVLDSDSDNIPDAVEMAIRTNPEKMDTDNDSFNDLPEIKSGYSPIIAGAAGKYTLEQWQALKDKIKAADNNFFEKTFGSNSGALIDSDSDGILDVVEKAIGTDPGKADSDGDGFNDLAEIKSGYSPVIAGAAGKYTSEQLQALNDKIKAADSKFYESVFGASVVSPSSSPIASLSPSPVASLAPISFICGTGTVSDIDNNIYKTLKIAEQCWLKENLKVTKNPIGEAITRYCYDNDPKICDTDGGLYDWNTAMNKSITEGAQGICPNGWHIPKDSEWYVLENGLKDLNGFCHADRNGVYDCDSAGTKLRQRGSSGFEAIFAGSRQSDSSFLKRNVSVYFWSSTENIKKSSTAWVRSLGSSISAVESSVVRFAGAATNVDYSLRCLKD